MSKIIGQKNLISNLERMHGKHNFPPLITLIAPDSYGKNFVAGTVLRDMGYIVCQGETSADNVREIVEQSYSFKYDAFYIFPDIQEASHAAQTALLKVTEQPPEKAHFIITSTSRNYVFNTLLSRSFVIELEPYTSNDIETFAKEYKFAIDMAEPLIRFIQSPGQLYRTMDGDFRNLVALVKSYITTLDLSTGEKLLKSLKLKSDGVGWDVSFFTSLVISMACEELKITQESQYWKIIKAFNTIYTKMLVTGVNKHNAIESVMFNLIKEVR